MPIAIYRKERMPCGCKQGRWTTQAVTADASGGGLQKGPKAPGYTAPTPETKAFGPRKKGATVVTTKVIK
jgi:hypothetical protein